MVGLTQLWTTDYGSFRSRLPNVSNSAGRFKFKFGSLSPVQVDNEDAADALIQNGDANISERFDFLHVIGHSTSEGPEFYPRLRDNGVAAYTEVAWGTGALRWVVIDGCLTLNAYANHNSQTSIFARWGTTFQGLRGLYGFASVCASEKTRGGIFATQLKENDPIWLAWMKACQESDTAQFATLTAAIAGSESSPVEGVGAEGDPGDDGAALDVATPVFAADTWPEVTDGAAIDASATGLIYFTAFV